MFGYKVAHWATIAGPQNTDIMIELMLILRVLPNNNENVIHEMIPAISLKNTFKTPTLNRFIWSTRVLEFWSTRALKYWSTGVVLVLVMVVLTGWIKTVEGIVQKTIVVPKIDKMELTFEGMVFALVSSYLLFKKILYTSPKNPAKV